MSDAAFTWEIYGIDAYRSGDTTAIASGTATANGVQETYSGAPYETLEIAITALATDVIIQVKAWD